MRMISGAILLLAAEEAFANSLSIGFPNAAMAQEILFPASLVLAICGLLLLVWGIAGAEFSGNKHSKD